MQKKQVKCGLCKRQQWQGLKEAIAGHEKGGNQTVLSSHLMWLLIKDIYIHERRLLRGTVSRFCGSSPSPPRLNPAWFLGVLSRAYTCGKAHQIIWATLRSLVLSWTLKFRETISCLFLIGSYRIMQQNDNVCIECLLTFGNCTQRIKMSHLFQVGELLFILQIPSFNFMAIWISNSYCHEQPLIHEDPQSKFKKLLQRHRLVASWVTCMAASKIQFCSLKAQLSSL